MREALNKVMKRCDRGRYFNQAVHRYEAILYSIDKRCSGGKVLDVGASPGHLSMALSYAGYEVHSIVYDDKEDYWEGTDVKELQFSEKLKN